MLTGLKPHAGAPDTKTQMEQPDLALHGSRRRQALDRGLRALPTQPDALAREDSEREALMRVAAAAAAASSLQDVMELASEAALEALNAGSFSMSRWERDRQVMCTLINVGDLGPGEERYPEDETYALADHPTVAKLLQTGTPYFTAVDDPDADPRSVALLRELGKESDIGVPVVVDGEVWGEVWASTAPGAPRFRASDVRFLEAIAAQLAGVIARAELFSDVSRLAYEDPLTGLANRRALEERLETMTEDWRERSVPVAALLSDVDDLKSINDSRGHHAGDRALRRVGEALVAGASAYPGAMVARLAGDEFAVLLPGRTLADAKDVGATALTLLAEDRDTPVSISCGAVEAGPGIERSGQILRAADSAQYAAKQRGGGQVCTAEASALHEMLAPRRRPRRRGITDRLDKVSEQLLEMLDGELAERHTLDRLEVVVAHFAETVNAAAWTISFAAHGSPTIRSIVTSDDRDNRLRGIRVGLGDEVYELADYPATARLVEAGAGSFLVERHDRNSDPAERDLLAELGFYGVLGATTSDLDGVYLLELYADGDTADLAAAELRVQLVFRAAAGRSASAAGMGPLDKHTMLLASSGALGARLAGLVDEADIVELAADELFNQVGVPLCSIVRVVDDTVEIAAGRGAAVERLRAAGWSQPRTVGLIGRALRDAALVNSDDVRLEPDHRATGETESTRSELCVPLWAGDRLWGVIDLHSDEVGAFGDDEVRLATLVADQVSAALRSARLYHSVEQAYLDTAEALTAALEAKNLYTAGHSRSIAEHAGAVGLRMGLEPGELRILRFAAAFHDSGKLAIPEAILDKTGRLTAEERRRVEQHSVIGEQILAPIEFLDPVRPIVRHTHERWDGAGYPDGLSGDAIPLGARIIFACDAYDAMTTDRPYRDALDREAAMRELVSNAGSQFDPDVVHALLAVLDEQAVPAS